MSKEAVTVAIGADITPLSRALTHAKGKVKDFGTSLKDSTSKNFSGQGLDKFLGVGAVVAGFTSIISRAQDLRTEARELGKDLDPAVQRVAELGDAFVNAKTWAVDFGVSTLGYLGNIGEKAGGVAAKLIGLTKGQSFAETDEIIKNNEASGANADRMEKELKDPKVAANIAKAAKIKEDARRKELSDYGLIQTLLKDRAKLEAESVDKSKTLVQRTAAKAELEAKIVEISQLRNKMQQEADKEREANLNKIAQKEKEIADERANEFKKEQDAEQELADAQIANAKAQMTEREKFIALVREGRKAQKDADANPSDVKALTKLTKLRGEYNEMLRNAPMKDAKERAAKVDLDAGDRNEKGKIVGKNGGIVSQEDRDRSRATSVKAEAEAQKTRAQAIGETGKIGESKPAADASGEALKGISTGVEDLNSQLKNLINKFN